MLLWLLGALFLIGAIASYCVGERNVVAPVVLFLGTWTACLGLAAYNQQLWGFRLSPATFAVIGLGGLEFVAVSYLVRNWFYRRYGVAPAVRDPQPRHDVGVSWLLGIDAVIGVAFVAYFARVLAIIPEAPSWGERLRLFKEQTSISHTAVLPSYVGQLFRLSQILAFFLAYLLATSLASQRTGHRRDRIAAALQLAGLGMFCVTLFLSSDRLAIVALLLGFVACWALQWQQRRGVEGLTRRFAVWAGVSIVTLFGAFYLVAPLIGRNRSESPLAYIALYGGGAIALLNDFLQNRPPSVPVPGLESFYTLNLKLHHLGLAPPLDPYPPIHLENRYLDNVQMGNVYTAYRRWIYDFGYLGAAVLHGLMALVLNVVFCINRHLAGKDRAFWMVLYAFTLYSVIFHPVDSYFTMQFVSQTFCITLVLMKLVSVVVLRRPNGEDGEREEKKSSAQTSGNRISALAMSTQATSSLKLNAGMNMVLQFSIIFIPLITYPYVTRTLFEQGMGKAQVALNIVGYFAMIAQVGIPTYGVTACARVRDDLPKLRQTAKELLALSLGFSMLAYLLLAVVVLAVPALRADWLIYVVISSQILLQAVGVDWLFKALEHYTYLTLANLGIRLAMLAATFVFVRGPGDALAFGLISVLSLAGSGLLNVVRARGFLTGAGTGPLQLRQHVRPSLVFFWLTVAGAVYTQVDTVLLRFLRNEAEVGFYSVATKVKQALVAVVTALGAVMLPRVTYHAQRQEWERFNQLLRTTISVVLMLSLPLALFFGLYAGPTIRILGGARFAPGIAMLQLIIGSLVFIGVTNILGFQLLIPTRRDKIVVYSVVVGAVVDIVLNFALVPQLGGRGTAIATLVAEFAVLLFQLRATREQSWPAFAAVRWGNLALALVAAAAASGVVLLVPLPDLVRFIIGGFACFGAYVAVLGWRRDAAVLGAASMIMQRVKGSS